MPIAEYSGKAHKETASRCGRRISMLTRERIHSEAWRKIVVEGGRIPRQLLADTFHALREQGSDDNCWQILSMPSVCRDLSEVDEEPRHTALASRDDPGRQKTKTSFF